MNRQVRTPSLPCLVVLLGCAQFALPADPALEPPDLQLPRKMHGPMKERPRVVVGQREGDIVGKDQRALQAAVDYIAGLGGGTIEIGPGTYTMGDSLHLRPSVTVRGTGGQTVLRKADGASSPLAVDGDYGEEQVTVRDSTAFAVGAGVAVWDRASGGFHTTVARIIGRSGDTLILSKPLNADCMVANGAMAATVYPVVSGYDLEGCVIEDLIIDGNRANNPPLNGCRGAGVFLYRGFGTVIRRCTVRDYPGDGFSFQQSNDVVLEDCAAEGNAGLGLHPGSGSQRPTVRNCVARANGEDGLFLCWRVKSGVFEDNRFEGNGRHGISIGHKDTDNLFRRNQVRGNHQAGVLFREETEGMAGHRNRFENNVIENNGLTNDTAGVAVRGQTRDLVFRENVIRDTRPASERRQTIGVQIGGQAGLVSLESNRIEAATPVEDRRKTARP